MRSNCDCTSGCFTRRISATTAALDKGTPAKFPTNFQTWVLTSYSFRRTGSYRLSQDKPTHRLVDGRYVSRVNRLLFFYSDLYKESIQRTLDLERETLVKCALTIYTSDWAAQTAKDIYGIDPSKLRVVPWGPISRATELLPILRTAIDARDASTCRLLFVGVDWERKGGHMALEVAKGLNRAGLRTELTIVGCEPANHGLLPDFVKVAGFIDKSTAQGKSTFDKLMAESHFLILPTKAETFRLVFAEANSFGVPCVASNVGGLPTVIRDGFNGKTFPLNADSAEYSAYILSLMAHPSTYKQFARTSFHEYQTRLNWKVACDKVRGLLFELGGDGADSVRTLSAAAAGCR